MFSSAGQTEGLDNFSMMMFGRVHALEEEIHAK
jgi:hypothetical protein